MVRKLIEWAVNNPLIALLLAVTLVVLGGYAVVNVNVEAYPDPAPAIIEVVAQFPPGAGASAEEMERQVTIPLEVALAGMPGLTYTRSKSLFGLSHLRNQFDYGIDYEKAKQEVINRLQLAQLPPGDTPQISPQSPTGEIFRYTLSNPKGSDGKEIYTLNDLKTLQDWTLQRVFLRVPRIAGVSSSGGSVKRYEIHPDPDRLIKYGITLTQLQNAVANSNANVGGDYLVVGNTVQVVRGVGLLGGGHDPMQDVLGLEIKELEAYLATATDLSPERKQRILDYYRGAAVEPPFSGDEELRLRDIRGIVGRRAAEQAVAHLRSEEARRIEEIRKIVVTSVNNVPVRVEDLVEGGRVYSPDDLGKQGVVVGHQTRLGRASLSRRHENKYVGAGNENHGGQWIDEDDKVQAVILLRKGYESRRALHDVAAKIKELNDRPGRLLPGVAIEPYYDRRHLIGATTGTVSHNLVFGMVLVTVILLMFLGNVRSALIVAINIPLALLFAFFMLFARGRSANLLSIGAVDFGIIVDSTVIIVENIYRHVSSHEHAELPLKQRIIRACAEVERSLFYSTVIMVCALLPLFTMKGPEGQIFTPMADTYAFALGGALLLALIVSPVLCLFFFKRLKPARDNVLVRWLKGGYLWQLKHFLNYRWAVVGIFAALTLATAITLPFLGREFMPELEEGNMWIRGTFPIYISFEEVSQKAQLARAIMEEYPEVQLVMSQVGRPDDGTDPTGFYNAEFLVPLKPQENWPIPPGRTRPRTKPELVREMDEELSNTIVGVDWDFSQNIRDNVMEALSGVKGENSIKIFGPDLDELERLAGSVKEAISTVDGVANAGVFRIKGQSNLEFPINRDECARWGVNATDVHNVIQTAVGGKAFTQMIEGEKSFDVTLRWPERLRRDEQAILNIPVDLSNHTVTPGYVPSLPQTPLTSPSTGLSLSGTSVPMPSLTGSAAGGTMNNFGATPRIRLCSLVTPLNAKGQPDPKGSFIRPGASTISREQGRRFIAVKFGVQQRDLASTVAEAQRKVAPLLQPPYRAEWSGEFQEMQEAEHRLAVVLAVSLVLIFILLYLAFHSILDALVVFSNIVAMSLGGVWALWLTGTNFNISAAVGFISILGVAVMNGLLLVSSFNQLRAQGVPLQEAIPQGVAKLIRPVAMTALAALFGLLPAALSTAIGSQSQRPLAIVVVGGMIATLLFVNIVPVLYSFYGKRQPSALAGRLGH